jgi:hypothetical protein
VYNLCRIAALEAELEEEQTQSEMLMERARKSQTSVEQLTAELATERGICLPPVFRIRAILVWIRIRIRGSMPLTNNGSGSGYFRH